MAEPLSDDEKALFSNSAYSNPYWSDSVDAEDQELIRGEITRRQQELPWRSGRLKRIIREGAVYPCEELNARSFARFQLWLAELRSEDPKQHALIVKWFREDELKAERERHRQKAIRKLEAERARVRAIAEMIAGQTAATEENEAAQRAAWNEQRIRDHDGADRRRAEANYQHEQEQARQAAYQASENARRSEPTCVFCDRPGMHHTASGWMCGIHLHHLM